MKLSVVSFLLAAVALFQAPTVVESSVAGVDFGGEFFKIALVKPGRPFEIVTNIHSKRKTETIVSFNGEERLFGADAMNIEVRRPQVAYSQIRRLLGTTVTHPIVESMTKNEYFPYTLTHNLTRGSVGLQHTAEQTFHAEELVAMVFTHAKQITNDFAEAPIRDWVVTVPMYFAEAQRQAVIDAAEIAGIRVLSLIDENTAAALHHGVSLDAPEPGKPERVLFYNFGSTSLQVSLVEYTSRIVPDGFKKNKTIIDFEVLAKAWDETLGGSQFDLRLADKFADEFNQKLKTGEDVRQIPRAMAKLRAAARKTKIVLSANEEIPVVVPSLHADLDFKGHAKRSEFEALCADLFARVLAPVDAVMAKSGLSKSDLKDIEIIGGAVRIPKVQALLKEYFDRDLGQHLNGDEAMALGAAFHGANLSTSFRVRHVGMTDIASFPIGVRLVDLHQETTTGDENDDAADAKHWVKRAALFGESQRLNVKKSVSFSHATDVSCTFRYDQPSSLPAGTSAQIARYNITGIDAFVAKMAEKNLGEPKVTLSFMLDGSGLATIVKAEATLEEEVEVVEKKKVKKTADKKKETDTDAADKDATDATDEKKDDDDDEVVEVKTKQKKVHRAPLTVVRADSHHEAGLSIVPMNIRTKKESIALLSEMDKADTIRKTNAEAKNRLESFVYESREYLSQQEDALAQVSTAAQREKLAADVDATEEWLYDDGEDLDAAAYNERFGGMRDQLDAMIFRVTEITALPEAIKKAEQYAISTKDLMEQWTTEKPQVTEAERADIVAKVDELQEWLVDEKAKQDKVAKHEAPVFTSTQVLKKISSIKKLVTALGKKPKPVEKKKEEEPKKTDAETTDAEGKKDEEDKAATADDAESSEGAKKDEL
ncbi:Aste57867_21816 [Aphanomyces stellatus]|uniref:Aste57867_21816 protein n=1 Tax=Aphanomyces stellatus TaxID=120398 RepID=A0A485LIJ1_9STRA|nr:hypothetical protein As57867_021747 [Aphanomyces stellatus]VFT98485.1 Aste57867_21816 [Aphanomyces stellatus]